MTAGVDGGGSQGRRFAALALVVLNVGLLALNLDKHGALPVSTGLWSGEASGAGDTSTVQGASDPADDLSSRNAADGGVSDDVGSGDGRTGERGTTDSSIDSMVGSVEESLDDWPGGRGPEPAGPPTPRSATLEPDGRLILNGSVPDWATATRISQVAGANLPGGLAGVSNERTWHPAASDDIRSGDVRVAQAATFADGGAVIQPESTATLDLAAEMLKSRPSLFVVVIGHSDDVGDEKVNAQLAVDRANAVVEYFVGAGVAGGQIVVAASSDDDSTASNLPAEGRKANRWIELQFKNFFVSPQDSGLSG